MVNVLHLFKGAAVNHLTIESVPATGTLSLSTNETDESFAVVTGDRLEDEYIEKLYLTRTGSGTATIRLNAKVRRIGTLQEPESGDTTGLIE